MILYDSWRLVGRLNEFLDDWLRNCVDQGHKIGCVKE